MAKKKALENSSQKALSKEERAILLKVHMMEALMAT
jgi:hypothetical protein